MGIKISKEKTNHLEPINGINLRKKNNTNRC